MSGSGLGLAISRRIVEAHGGTLGFDPDPDVGATAILRLPVVSPVDGRSPLALAGARMRGMSRRVLVVEDDPEFAGLLALWLERAGLSPRIAATGSEAMRAVYDDRPDLVTLDVGLARSSTAGSSADGSASSRTSRS